MLGQGLSGSGHAASSVCQTTGGTSVLFLDEVGRGSAQARPVPSLFACDLHLPQPEWSLGGTDGEPARWLIERRTRRVEN